MLWTLLGSLVVLSQGTSLKERLNVGEKDYVVTPFGLRPRQCVLHPEEENHRIEPVANNGGTWVSYPDSGRRVFYPPLPECIADAMLIKERQDRKRKAVESKNINDYSNNKVPESVAEKVGILGDGWQIYGGWYPPSLMGYFTVNMTLPNQMMTDDGQIMYYFIGMQNNDQPTDVTIIQPVVTYCENGCANTEKGSTLPGWSGNSWNCCPSGQTWFSTPIQLAQGQVGVLGSVYSDATDENVIVLTSFGTSVSNLTIQQDSRKYDWVDVTLEAYDYGVKCSAFSDMPFLFNNMTMTATDNSVYSAPAWTTVDNSICQGTITYSMGGLQATIIGNTES